MYAYDRELHTDDGTLLATFSSHWAACAAMIRRADPTFVSMGGDKPEDLALERDIFQREADAEYDPQEDMRRSVAACYEAVRDRVAAGGPLWDPTRPPPKVPE